MASNNCRFCCNAISPNHCSSIFSSLALSKDLPVRLSALLQLPVSSDDGHPPNCCRPCMRKFLQAESFVTIATQLRFRSANPTTFIVEHEG